MYKLAFISYYGDLIGACALRGKTKIRHGSQLFYTVGGERYTLGVTRDMKTDDCNFANDYQYVAPKNRFPSGDPFPIGLALINNQSPTVIRPISLDLGGNGYKKVRIDSELKKKIRKPVRLYCTHELQPIHPLQVL